MSPVLCFSRSFFFSSRRRHTRCGHDWSSDVCSSDLISHRADSQFAEVLWALHQRLALLQGGDKIDERSNPVSPIQFCDNVRRVLQELKLDARTKVLGYKDRKSDV